MKKRANRIPLILIMILTALLLSGCGALDTDLIAMVIEAYAEDRGIIEGDSYSPMALVRELNKAMVAEVTNDEDFIELDGVDVVKDIEKADQLADEALEELDTAKVQSAVSIRPEDWRLQEKSAAVWLAHENGAAAQTAFTKSDDLLLDSLHYGGDCLTLRRQQLETRLQTLWSAIQSYEAEPGHGALSAKTLREEHGRVRAELQSINTYGESTFCGD